MRVAGAGFRSFELLVEAPAVEALGEPLRFVVAAGEEELARPIRLLDAHVLVVDLPRAKPQINGDELHRPQKPPSHRSLTCADL